MGRAEVPRGVSLRTKIILSMALLAFLVAGATSATQYYFRRGELIAEFQAFVRSVAGTCALSISAADVAAIRGPGDTSSDAFARTKSVLAKVRDINRLKDGEIYILRPVSAAAAGLFDTEFVAMPHERAFVGDRYSIQPANRGPFVEAWRDLRPAATGIYADPHGVYISGYAPIVDPASGRAIAVIEVDAEISRFLERQRAALWTALAIGGGAFAIAAVPGLLLARTLTRGVNRLTDGIRRFQAGEYDVRVTVKSDAGRGESGDEIARMSAVFDEMIESLAERLALLPYVSRFTAEAVRRGRADPKWLTGMEQEVVVLFADLRGFTRFSEEREAAAVVRELNELLAVQAEIVVACGGDVDKFVGDRVMAVFLKDERAAGTAFACARELIARVHAATRGRDGALSLGVGIHAGSAVVGSIGSAARRDFTAIGHTVNLASRLCDRAGPWEVMVSEDVAAALSAAERAPLRANEAMQFKNVSRAVVTYGCVCA
jgi:class 3 adenylate cyclase